MPTKATKQPKLQANQEKVRHALFIAACNIHSDGTLGYSAASVATGFFRQSIHSWAAQYPEMVEEAKRDAALFIEEKRSMLRDKYLEIATLATDEILRRLRDEPRDVKFWNLNGTADYATKNHQLLSGRATGKIDGSIKHDHSVKVFERFIELKEKAKQELNGDSNNRIKSIN